MKRIPPQGSRAWLFLGSGVVVRSTGESRGVAPAGKARASVRLCPAALSERLGGHDVDLIPGSIG